MRNQRKCYFSFIVWMRLNKVCTPPETALRQLFNRQSFWIGVLSLNGRMAPNGTVSHELWCASNRNNFTSLLMFLKITMSYDELCREHYQLPLMVFIQKHLVFSTFSLWGKMDIGYKYQWKTFILTCFALIHSF